MEAIGAPRRGYKAKTIKSILAKKMQKWLDSIEDPAVKELASKGTIVTGGSIASMLLGEEVNDFDIYFRDFATCKAVAEYYVKRFEVKNKAGIVCPIFVQVENQTILTPIPETESDPVGEFITGKPRFNETTFQRVKVVIKSAGIASEDGTTANYTYFESRPADEAAGYVGEVMQDAGDIQDQYEESEAAALANEEEKFRPVFMSTNAITLSGKIQIVLRFYGEPDAIHENYDFVHCTNHYKLWDGELVLKAAALEALLARELRYVGSRYPICSLIRLRKFIKRGWTINAGQILKMVMQVSELDLKNVKVLEDQLTGVDVAYFLQVISAIKQKDPEKVNAAYLVEILDRMF